MPVVFGVLLFVITLGVLGYLAKQMVSGSPALKEHKEQIKAERAARAAEDANVTHKEPGIEHAAKTEEKKQHDVEKVDQEQIIESSFSILHGMTDPGQLRFDNPSLPPLITALTRQREYLRKREGELLELEAHIQEQLQELHKGREAE